MELLRSPIKKEDETRLFKEVLQTLSARSPAEVGNLLRQMSDINKKRI